MCPAVVDDDVDNIGVSNDNIAAQSKAAASSHDAGGACSLISTGADAGSATSFSSTKVIVVMLYY